MPDPIDMVIELDAKTEIHTATHSQRAALRLPYDHQTVFLRTRQPGSPAPVTLFALAGHSSYLRRLRLSGGPVRVHLRLLPISGYHRYHDGDCLHYQGYLVLDILDAQMLPKT